MKLLIVNFPPPTTKDGTLKKAVIKAAKVNKHLSLHVTLSRKGKWPAVMGDGGSPLHLWPVPARYTGGSVSQKVEPQSKQYPKGNDI